MIICEEKLCCGCGACRHVCPVNAVEMVADAEGFLRPFVDEAKCIGCKRCERECPVNKINASEPEKSYAAFSKDADVRNSSSSGGVFYHLAKVILDEGGVVFGAAFDKDMRVCHRAAENENELRSLMGSKYVQRDASEVYDEVGTYLSEGRKVLFSGTPCQCAAIKNVFGDREGLYLVDFICHGVPTPLIWKKFIEEEHSGATDASFRNKKRGWEEFSMKVDTPDGEYNVSRYKDPYLRMFLMNVALRPSCYSCSWKGEGYTSDITVADFWGISKVYPALHDDKGISLVIERGEKGKLLLERARDRLCIYSAPLEKSVRSNGAYAASSKLPARRGEFFERLIGGESFVSLSKSFALPMKHKDIFKIRMITLVKRILAIFSKKPGKEN
ncbi:MAG: Coenzyme F420 hydrogenase/dehydrogenase, beta subunit C-terminal domain [Clostridia bacterium]|nr:Coenzyme F420 hydrogenase/dehydrogenase, beta subunit C-terminal domain [Clostridia bacterium]